MSDSNRGERNTALNTAFGLIAAFALVAIVVGVLAFSQGKEWERRYQAPAEYAQTAKEHAANACTGREAAAVFECVYEKVEASQAQAQAEQDLDAQQGMKLWAAVMAILTALTAFVTAIGVWLVKQTLDATLEAVEDTGQATAAMIDANRIAEESSHRQIRAYVAAKSLTVQESPWGDGMLQFLIELQNVGQTPATIVRIVMLGRWIKSGDWSVLLDHDAETEFRCNHDIPTFMPFEFPDEFEGSDVEGHFLIMGRVEYLDVFMKRHTEPFGFRSPNEGRVTLYEQDLPVRLSTFPINSLGKEIRREKTKRKRAPEK